MYCLVLLENSIKSGEHIQSAKLSSSGSGQAVSGSLRLTQALSGSYFVTLTLRPEPGANFNLVCHPPPVNFSRGIKTPNHYCMTLNKETLWAPNLFIILPNQCFSHLQSMKN